MKRDDTELLERLSRWMDGAMDESGEAEFASLLEANPELREIRDAWASIGSDLRTGIPSDMDGALIEDEWASIVDKLEMREVPNAVRQRRVIPFPMHWFAGAFAAAAALALTLGAVFWEPFGGGKNRSSLASGVADPSISFVETGIEGASSMVYVDESSGWTIVWVVEPDVSNGHVVRG